MINLTNIKKMFFLLTGNSDKEIYHIETFRYKNKDYFHNIDEFGREKKGLFNKF